MEKFFQKQFQFMTHASPQGWKKSKFQWRKREESGEQNVCEMLSYRMNHDINILNTGLKIVTNTL